MEELTHVAISAVIPNAARSKYLQDGNESKTFFIMISSSFTLGIRLYEES
jgi:hypothetical protein